MEEKKDLRVTKTYTALVNSFWKLIKRKQFSEITINELCEKAMIQSQTFYKHFTDKYDFLVFVILQKEKEYSRKMESQNKYLNVIDYYIGLLEALLNLIDSNENLVTNLDVDNRIIVMMKNTLNDLAVRIKSYFDKDIEAGYQFPADSEIMTQFFVGAISQIVFWWFLNRKYVSKEEMLKRVSPIIENFYAKAAPAKIDNL